MITLFEDRLIFHSAGEIIYRDWIIYSQGEIELAENQLTQICISAQRNHYY